MDFKKIWIHKLFIFAVCMLFAGIVYAWSVLKVPLAEEFRWNDSQLALNFTLTLCFFCIGGKAASRLARIFSARLTMFLAACAVAAGFFFCSSLSGNIWMLYLFYAGFTGTGIGIAYNIIISTANAWFPDKKGLCSGVLMMCFGLSSLIIGKGADRLFAIPAVGWRGAYFLLGIITGSAIAVCGLAAFHLPPDVTVPTTSSSQYVSAQCGKDLSTSEMIRTPHFWKFFCFSVLTSASGSAIISFAWDLAHISGASAPLATTLVGVLSVCNGMGRILCGLISDTWGVRSAMVLSNIIALLAPVAVLFGVQSSALKICAVGLCFTGIAYGFLATIISAFTAAFYGLAYFSSNYSLSNMMLFPASFGATLASLLLERSGGYTLPLLMLTAFSACALVINLSISKKR